MTGASTSVVDGAAKDTECARWQTWHCSSPAGLLCQWFAVSKEKDNAATMTRMARSRRAVLRDMSELDNPKHGT